MTSRLSSALISPKNTLLERGELTASLRALEVCLLAHCGRAAKGARKGRCGFYGVAHGRGLSVSHVEMSVR